MKRLQGISISGDAIGAIAATCEHVPVSAVFRHAYFDYERNVFVCVFEDASFSDVLEGNRIPVDVESADRGTKRKKFTVVYEEVE